MTGMVFALLGLAVLAAAVGFTAWRGERTRRLGLEGEVTGLRGTIESEHRALEEKTSERRERGDEVAELRRRLEKAKRRAFSLQEERAPLEARASALEAELRDREAECKRLRDEVAKLEGDVDGARRDTARLREEMRRAPVRSRQIEVAALDLVVEHDAPAARPQPLKQGVGHNLPGRPVLVVGRVDGSKDAQMWRALDGPDDEVRWNADLARWEVVGQRQFHGRAADRRRGLRRRHRRNRRPAGMVV